MPDSRELRKLSLDQLKGNWKTPIISWLVYLLIVCVAGVVPYVGFIIQLAITGPMMLGITYIFVSFKRRQSPEIEDIFLGFNNYKRASCLYLLSFMYTLLWSLLLVVPGIIASYRYSMAIYILNDHPKLSANSAINISKQLMDGLKMKLFLLDISFAGWVLVCILTLGIGFLWLAPYMTLARVSFYEIYIKEKVILTESAY